MIAKKRLSTIRPCSVTLEDVSCIYRGEEWPVSPALAQQVETFCKGCGFVAWLGLTPVQRSTGSKPKFGATFKIDERTMRSLIIIGAVALEHQTSQREIPPGSWLARMLRMLVITALANKMARTVWALLALDEVYRAVA